MEALKEYAGVITAAVTVFAALGALGLWAINVQVTPELHRLDGKLDANLKVINQRFNLVDERFEHIDGRFDRVEDEIKTIRNDIKTILLRLPPRAETG